MTPPVPKELDIWSIKRALNKYVATTPRNHKPTNNTPTSVLEAVTAALTNIEAVSIRAQQERASLVSRTRRFITTTPSPELLAQIPYSTLREVYEAMTTIPTRKAATSAYGVNALRQKMTQLAGDHIKIQADKQNLRSQ